MGVGGGGGESKFVAGLHTLYILCFTFNTCPPGPTREEAGTALTCKLSRRIQEQINLMTDKN